MTTAYIDTDVLIRLLTNDDQEKRDRTKKLFEQVEKGELTVTAPLTVVADAVYVLSSPRLYRQPRQKTAAQLTTLVRLPNFKIKQRRSVLRALELFATTNLDFSNCVVVSFMQQDRISNLYSFEQDYDKIKVIRRKEP